MKINKESATRIWMALICCREEPFIFHFNRIKQLKSVANDDPADPQHHFCVVSCRITYGRMPPWLK